MSESGSSFYRSLAKLSRNPLGIIALFIALTYAIASLVLGLGANLTIAQKWPLIIFLVAFPVIVLICFLWLVVNYNQKLYSPEDYRNDESFLETLQPGEKEKNEDAASSSAPSYQEFSEKKADLKQEVIPGDSDLPARIASDLVLRDLEIEMKVPFRRQSGFKTGMESKVVPFSGIAKQADQFIAVDIKFTGSQKNYYSAFTAWVTKKLQLESVADISEHVRYLFVIVTKNYSAKDEELIQKEVAAVRNRHKVKIDVRFYDFDELLSRYQIH